MQRSGLSVQCKYVIDYTVFLGMHHENGLVRAACKNFMISHKESIMITLDQAGNCDEIIWRLCPKLQNIYYPFMDSYHSQKMLKRIPCSNPLLLSQAGKYACYGLNALAFACAKTEDAFFVTCSRRLDAPSEIKKSIKLIIPHKEREKQFAGTLERLYSTSLAVKLTTKNLEIV